MGNKPTIGVSEFIFQPVKISNHKLLFIMEMHVLPLEEGKNTGLKWPWLMGTLCKEPV